MNIYGPAWAEVDLDAIAHNSKEVKKFVLNNKKDTKVLAVVKADGYGHGAVEIAKTMSENGIDYFGVATIFEALELRKGGIEKPILNFSYTPDNCIEVAVKNHITINVYDYNMAKKIEEAGLKLGIIPKIHIKIDTGMARLGFLPNDNSIDEIEKITKLKLHVEGIFSHFALADSKDKENTIKQADKFIWVLDELEKRNITFEIRHICNSAAMMELPQYYFDMVRAGGILYGHFCLLHYMDKCPFPIKQALSIRAVLSNFNEVEAGTGVSYGWMYTTDKKSVIGTIPIGYTDGINRKNTNNAEFLIKGKRVKQVGLICMDQMMIDVTDIEDLKIGDIVTLLGRDGEEVITLEERAKAASIGKCELFAGIGRRLPKVYFKGGKYYSTVNYLLD